MPKDEGATRSVMSHLDRQHGRKRPCYVRPIVTAAERSLWGNCSMQLLRRRITPARRMCTRTTDLFSASNGD